MVSSFINNQGGETLKRLIIFLIRKRLGLKKNELFQFTNQKSHIDVYYFTEDKIMKIECGKLRPSSVKFNWMLDDECKIRKVMGDDV